jgi:hypothetical protein
VVCYFIALFAYMVTSFNKAFAEGQDWFFSKIKSP